MKLLPLFLALALPHLDAPHLAAAEPGDAKTELNQLVGEVNAKAGSGKHTEQDFAPQLKKFDALLDEHKGEQTDDVAQILFMKAMLYSEVFEDPAKASTLIKELKSEFPATKLGKEADETLATLAADEQAEEIQHTLAVGSPFPNFEVKDVEGKPLSVAAYKGKVVLIDFWATWCGPCMAMLPDLQKIYSQSHDSGFDIIGIDLDGDKDKLLSFLKDKNIPWQQYGDNFQPQNKLSAKYGVAALPSSFLLNKQGVIIGRNLGVPALETAIAKALASK